MAQTISSRSGLSPHIAISPDLTSTQRQSDEIKMNTNSSRLGLAPYLHISATGMQVVHATNGRIRIKATDGSFSTNVKIIIQNLKQYKGVKEVATNEQTSSMVVIFDENKLSVQQMLGILQQFNIQTLQDSPLSDPFAPWKSVDFWKEQTISFIPLMTGLAVTGGLGVSGLAAIPIYMLTTDATRRVIDYLEPQINGTDAVKESAKEGETREANNDPTPQTTVWSEKLAYTVVHEIPGRIRFHIPKIASDRAYAKRLERLLKTDAAVTNVRINTDAASLAIAYKNNQITVSHWVSLMELALQTTPPTITPNPQPANSTSDKLPTSSALEPATVTQVTEPEDALLLPTTGKTLNISSLWTDMQAPALSYSLNFIANLPL